MIVITGGGTGGHLAIADSVREAFNQEGIEPIFIGSTRGQDKEWFENKNGFQKAYFLESKGVMNKGIFGKFFSLINIIFLSFTAIKIFKKHKIEGIFSVGGYSAAPAAIAAVLTGKKLFIHEQNSVIGTLNKVLKPFSKRFFSSFFQEDYVDYPVKKIFFEKKRVRGRIKKIIFLGGSQGARAINNLALDLVDFFKINQIEVIHQCGRNDYERVKQLYKEKDFTPELFPFSTDLGEKIAQSDLAIARSGAGTLFELIANQIPAIFIPYPYAAKNHQLHNGYYLSKRDLGYTFQEKEISLETIKEIIKKDQTQISKNLTNLLKENGNRVIATTILQDLSKTL